MHLKSYITLSLLVLLFFLFISGKDHNGNQLHKPITNDHYNFIDINDIRMWVSNNGNGSHDPNTDGSGFYWPGGKSAAKAAIFEDGLIWGAIVGNDTLVNGNTHSQGLQAGKILADGSADNPDDPRYRVYKIFKYWEDLQPGPERDRYEKDYNEWPVRDGAPWVDIDKDGKFTPGIDLPEFLGDQVLWYVANDLDESRVANTFESSSIGLEFQTTVYGFSRVNCLKDVIFKKYLIINKSDTQLDNMYIGYWSDDDLGDAGDDYVGCDTLLNLGYTYNGDNQDGTGSGITYGTAPPAVGHMFVQGPAVPALPSDSARFRDRWITGYKNLSMTAFFMYLNSSGSLCPICFPWEETVPTYHFLMGNVWNGNSMTDPHTGLPINYVVPGDPVIGEGWYEGPGWPGGEDPDDRRSLISSGPFNMAPGDSQEVVIAILVARGESHIDSITELKKASQLSQIVYNLDEKVTPEIETPSISSVRHDQGVTLYWEPDIESFNQTDPLLQIQDVEDKTYTFEGYLMWQFRGLEGADPKVIATYDIRNDVIEIYGHEMINGFPAEVVAIYGPNEGIRRSHRIDNNAYDEKPLNNGNPYYFAVTAYAYSKFSDPSFIESEPEIIEVIPGLKKIDQTYPLDAGEKILAEHISGNGDGTVELIIVDPEALTGDEYRVIFNGEGEDAAYSFLNYTTNDTIISDCTDYYIDTVGASIIDGFILKVDNLGWNAIQDIGRSRNYVVKEILETNGPNGIELDPPSEVFENHNSTGIWQISSYGRDPYPIQNININDQIGYQSYEIRFTNSGSEYYLTGGKPGFQPWRGHDPKAADRVPFEIWDMGLTDSEDDDIRISIKTMDDYTSIYDDSSLIVHDNKWSQLDNGDWEPIFAFLQDSAYQEPIPDMSGVIQYIEESRFGKFIIRGDLPEAGTVIQISTWQPMTSNDVFSVITTTANTKDYASAKTNIDDISVFPNPFFGFSHMSGYIKQDFMRFTNLPVQVSVRIFSLGGTYVRRLEKNDDNPWLDWDLKNNAGQQVASGVYIAHVEMPNIGEKVMKLAVILENQR